MEKNGSTSAYQVPHSGPSGGLVTLVYHVAQKKQTVVARMADDNDADVVLGSLENRIRKTFAQGSLTTQETNLSRCSVQCTILSAEKMQPEAIIDDIRTVLTDLLNGTRGVKVERAGVYHVYGVRHDKSAAA